MRRDILQLADAGLKTLAASVLHTRFLGHRLIRQYCKNIWPIDDGPAGKVSETQDRLHLVACRQALSRKLDGLRKILIPLSELEVQFSNHRVE